MLLVNSLTLIGVDARIVKDLTPYVGHFMIPYCRQAGEHPNP